MAIRFRRDGYAHGSVADTAALRLSTWTIGGNFRLDVLPASQTFTLIAKGGLDSTTTAAYYLAYQEYGGTYSLLSGFWDTGAGAAKTATTTQALVAGRWYAIWATYDGTNLKLYLGTRETALSAAAVSTLTLLSTTALSGTVGASTQAVRFGAGVTSAGDLQDGANASAADLAIYTGAIAQSTLEGRLATFLAGSETSLRGAWRGDDGMGGAGGSTAYDRTGNARDMTLLNYPSWTDGPMDLSYSTGLYSGAILGWYTPVLRPACTITASQEDSAYPASYLRNAKQAFVWRTTDATGAKTITYDFGMPIPIGLVTVRNTNWTSAATNSIALNTADSWGVPAVTETVTFAKTAINWILTRPYQYRYMRWSVTNAAAGSYVQAGLIQPWTVQEIFGSVVTSAEEWSIDDISTAVTTTHRHRVGRNLTKTEGLRVDITRLKRGHALELQRIFRHVGGGAPIVFCPNPKLGLYGRSIYGIVSAIPTLKPMGGSPELWSLTGLGIAGDRA